MLDRAIRDSKLDNRPLDLSFLDDILEHMRKPRPSDSDKIDKRLLIKFNQFNPNSKSIKSNLIGTKSASPVLIKNIGQMKRSHLENALSYALENSETAYNEMFLECDKQFILETWLNDFDLTKDYNEAMHLVFSIKDKPDEETMHGLLNSTWETLKVRLPEYKFALVPHTHQDHAHIHCFINKTNQLTQRRLRFKGCEDCKEFFNALRSEFAYRLNEHSLSEEYLYVNEPKLKELDNIKQQLQDLEKEEKALEQIKTPQDEWDLNKALQKEYLQELKDKNKAKALDIQNNHSTPLKQKISEFKIALFNHKDTSDDEKEQLDIDRIDKRKPVSEHLKHIQVEEQNYSILIQGKGRKERKAYIKKSLLEPSLNAWLSDDYRLKYFNGVYLFKKDKQKAQNSLTLYNFIPLIFKLAQIKHYKQYGTGLHLFRHSFATLIYQETQDLVLTSRALGHSSLLSTKIYIHTTQEHNKKVALVFDSLIENKK